MMISNDHLLALLFLVPALVLAALVRGWRQDALLGRFIEGALIPKVVPDFRGRGRSRWMEAAGVGLVVLCLVIAILRPRWGYDWRESKRRGVDIVVAVDVSESMLATDVPPNRLERARREIQDLVGQLQGDRVALVAFSGAAFLEAPLTFDYSAFRSFLPLLTPDLIPVPGTNVEAAVSEGIRALIQPTAEGQSAPKRERALILITDGEEFEGDMGNVRHLAADNGVRVYILGVGTEAGSPIPVKGGYKKDRGGNIVITRLRPDLLQALAVETGGVFVQSVPSEQDTDAIYRNGLKRALPGGEFGSGREKRWNEYFQAPLLVAALLFLWVAGAHRVLHELIWKAR